MLSIYERLPVRVYFSSLFGDTFAYTLYTDPITTKEEFIKR